MPGPLILSHLPSCCPPGSEETTAEAGTLTENGLTDDLELFILLYGTGKMVKYEALFFDMDGTIVENGSLMPAAFQKAFGNHGLSISIDPWRGSGATDYEVMDIYLSDYPFSDEQKNELKEKIAEDLRANVIRQVRQSSLNALPGVPELIAKLIELGIKPGLLTGNLEAIVGPKLTAAGMKREDFYYGGFGDHSPNRPETARRALASASAYFGHEIDPSRALVIGDTPNDIACARAVHADVLAVATGRFSVDQLSEYHPDHLLPDLSDTAGFLKIIGAA